MTRDGRTSCYHGDCIKILATLGQVFELVIADPPYNIGHPYNGFHDKITNGEYKHFTRHWLDAASGVLTLNGAMWVIVPDEIVSYVDEYVTGTIGLKRCNWCIWHFRFGQANRSRFIRSKVHLLYYVVNLQDRIWNSHNVLVPSDRATKYDDPRTNDSTTPGLRLPLDVWEFGRIQGNNYERCKGHPNQIPEKLIERIILSCSNSGSVVLDPFSGSGTTITVARALGRSAVGIEIVEEYAKSSIERAERGAVRVQNEQIRQ